MTRVLFIGLQPQTVDFSDPALPPGLDANKIQAGIDLAMRLMAERGWNAEDCMFTPDDAGIGMLNRKLAGGRYDCIVIGGGLRMPPKNLGLFEKVINAVHKAAPGASIAFNEGPDTTPAAVERWIRR
jgi:hypothetical protein